MLTTISVFLIEKSNNTVNDDVMTDIDPVSDVPFHDATKALTWRRYGQDQPLGSTLIHTFRSDEFSEALKTSYIIKQLIKHVEKISATTLDLVAEALFAKIKQAQNADEHAWEYRHSVDYYGLIESRMVEHMPRATWEHSFFKGLGAK